MNKINIIFLFLMTQISSASTVINNKNADLNITIYNDDLSFVNEIREANVKKGKQQLVYENIPSSVITQSVIPSFTGVSITLYSQNYSYNLISQKSMLKHSIDKQIKFKKIDKKDIYKTVTGILLSEPSYPDYYVLVKEDETNNIINIADTDIIFNKIPKNMITKPSLIWNIESHGAGKVIVDLKYLTEGISWRSDFVLNLNKNSLDLSAWVTVKNNSGIDFNNANIQFLAGQINKVQKRLYKYKQRASFALKEKRELLSSKVKEESFSGYHLYTIPFKESILNKEQKQIAFINEKNIKYSQYALNINDSFHYFKNKQELIFKNTIEFINTKENNLGIPLPQGTIRMYQKDSNGKTQFIGEGEVKNTPNKETVKLTIGTLFDIIGDKKIIKYTNEKNYKFVKAHYSVRNRGKDFVILKIKERNNYNHRNSVFESDCDNNCSVEKISAFYREFTIKLEGEETYEFDSSFELTK